ncbi:MAG TPA: response regulator [Pirellulales bacterium]|nr:response regulator [Pirellulales bacterium]
MCPLPALPPANLLLVEDNDDDVYIAKHAIHEGRDADAFTLHVARDGVEGLQFLRREAPFQNAPRPDLILLDLNMPRMDGREMLGVVKNDPDLKRIPIIILTTSDWEVDIIKAYDAHANSYMTKPVDLKKFDEQINLFLGYWFGLIVLPTANCTDAVGTIPHF